MIKIALSLHLRTRNKTKPTTANNNSTSPAGKKAAFKVAKPSNRTNRHKTVSYTHLTLPTSDLV